MGVVHSRGEMKSPGTMSFSILPLFRFLLLRWRESALSSKGKQKEKRQQVVKATREPQTHTHIHTGDVCSLLRGHTLSHVQRIRHRSSACSVSECLWAGAEGPFTTPADEWESKVGSMSRALFIQRCIFSLAACVLLSDRLLFSHSVSNVTTENHTLK